MELSEIVRDNFAYWLKSTGRQQRWVAEQLQVTENTVSRWKSGRLPMSLEQIAKVADLIGVPVAILLVKDGLKSPKEAIKWLEEQVSNF